MTIPIHKRGYVARPKDTWVEPGSWTLESTSEPEQGPFQPLPQVCRQGLALTPGSVTEAHTPSPLNSWSNFQESDEDEEG